MKIIVGLGNPGEKYKGTRHNAGRMFVEYLAEKKEFQDWTTKPALQFSESSGEFTNEKIALILPETFMNDSGRVFKKPPLSGLKSGNLLVAHDDIDLPLGKFKISFGRGSAGHKGVESIIRALKTKDFWRIRIGISPPKKPAKKDMLKFLLSGFRSNELATLKKCFKKILPALETKI